MGSLFDDVLQAINDWNPKAEYSTENKYRDNLLAFLRKGLDPSGNSVYYSPIWGFDSSRHNFIKEAGRSLADIGIYDEIRIELMESEKKKPHKQTGWLNCRLFKRILLCHNRFVWAHRSRGCRCFEAQS